MACPDDLRRRLSDCEDALIAVTDTQRDADWLHARCGMLTASRAKDMLAVRKDGRPSEARQTYALELVTERLTGRATERFTTAAMQWGTEQEYSARNLYGNTHGVTVEEVGFIKHDTLAAGCSPDGLIDWDGLIEIKCPWSSAVHVETWLHGRPAEHMAQIQFQLWITGRDWCDFVSYDPRMPERLRLYVERIPRHAGMIHCIDAEARTFLSEVDAMTESLLKRANP
jgi:hypothetical protein